MNKTSCSSILLVASILLHTACQSSTPVYQGYYFFSPASEGQVDPEISEGQIESAITICNAQGEIAARSAYEITWNMASTPPYYRPIFGGNEVFNSSSDGARNMALRVNRLSVGARARAKGIEVKRQCMTEQGYEFVSVCVSNCSV